MINSKIRHVWLGTATNLFYSTSWAEVDNDAFQALLQSGNKSITYWKAKKMHQRTRAGNCMVRNRALNFESGLKCSGKNLLNSVNSSI